MATLTSRIGISSLILMAIGCPEPDPCVHSDPATATLELGTGRNVFSPIQSGDILELDFGAQGGSHVYGSLNATGIAPGSDAFLGSGSPGPAVSFELVDGDTLVGESGVYQPVFRGNFSSSTLIGQIVFLHTFPQSMKNTEALTFRVNIEDVCGVQLTREVTVGIGYFAGMDSSDSF